MMKSLLVVACLFIFSVTLVHADAPAPTSQPAVVDTKPVNSKCPVSGDAIDPNITAIYNGKTYAFCCADCVKAFNKDPAKYAAAAK